MGKKILYVLMVSVFVLCVLAACSKKETQVEEETETTVSTVSFPEIPEEQRENIRQFFQIDIPEKGQVLYYEFELNKHEYGNVYAEIEFSQEYYEELMSQIEAQYNVEELVLMPDDKFETTREKLDKGYSISCGVRRRKVDNELTDIRYDTSYGIYTTKVENGTFRLLFVGYDT